jgi:phosphoribosyl 1,2-cyclic phosphodiesterase
MPIRFTVLGSGSNGNASLAEVDGFGVLLDPGLGPRQLVGRMEIVGRSWDDVHAVLLTHTHGDHWNDRTLAELRRRRIPLYCHASHHHFLLKQGEEFAQMAADGLVGHYEPDREVKLAPGFRCRPLLLHHDGGATFGFRLETVNDPAVAPCAIGYVTDLGTWTPRLVEELADANILAVEFNHDIELQRASRRSPWLIARVLGDHGHLSNGQAAALVQAVLRRSRPGSLRHLVQLHLSRDCNHETLAIRAAQRVLAHHDHVVHIHTTRHDHPGPILTLGWGPAFGNGALVESSLLASAPAVQQWLPGW